jgi:predicted nuclease of predicted toxin-antitoxin system
VKLLFDQNLSPRLIDLLADIYPSSAHVQVEGLSCSPDDDVWSHAKENGYVICTKDVDFHERSLLKGYPPKVIWINMGNCSTQRIEAALRVHSSLSRNILLPDLRDKENLFTAEFAEERRENRVINLPSLVAGRDREGCNSICIRHP